MTSEKGPTVHSFARNGYSSSGGVGGGGGGGEAKTSCVGRSLTPPWEQGAKKTFLQQPARSYEDIILSTLKDREYASKDDFRLCIGREHRKVVENLLGKAISYLQRTHKITLAHGRDSHETNYRLVVERRQQQQRPPPQHQGGKIKTAVAAEQNQQTSSIVSSAAAIASSKKDNKNNHNDSALSRNRNDIVSEVRPIHAQRASMFETLLNQIENGATDRKRSSFCAVSPAAANAAHSLTTLLVEQVPSRADQKEKEEKEKKEKEKEKEREKAKVDEKERHKDATTIALELRVAKLEQKVLLLESQLQESQQKNIREEALAESRQSESADGSKKKKTKKRAAKDIEEEEPQEVNETMEIHWMAEPKHKRLKGALPEAFANMFRGGRKGDTSINNISWCFRRQSQNVNGKDVEEEWHVLPKEVSQSIQSAYEHYSLEDRAHPVYKNEAQKVCIQFVGLLGEYNGQSGRFRRVQ